MCDFFLRMSKIYTIFAVEFSWRKICDTLK